MSAFSNNGLCPPEAFTNEGLQGFVDEANTELSRRARLGEPHAIVREFEAEELARIDVGRRLGLNAVPTWQDVRDYLVSQVTIKMPPMTPEKEAEIRARIAAMKLGSSPILAAEWEQLPAVIERTTEAVVARAKAIHDDHPFNRPLTKQPVPHWITAAVQAIVELIAKGDR